MQPVMKNSCWASYECRNSQNYIKVSDDAVRDKIESGVTEIIDTGNGALVIVNDVVIHRCAVVDKTSATGQSPAFGGERRQNLVRPICLYHGIKTEFEATSEAITEPHEETNMSDTTQTETRENDSNSDECEHEEGTRFQLFDEDGCGFYIWRCNNCGFEEIDDMP